MKQETKKTLIKAAVAAAAAAIGILATAVGLSSCNVSRVITNESKYLQKGDTAVVIQTKTTETYNAKKTN